MDTMATGSVMTFVSLTSRDLSDHVVGSQIALTSTSTGAITPLFALGADDAEVNYLADRPLNFSGATLKNLRALFSDSGKWSLDEQGILTVEEVRAKKVKAEEEICIQDVCVNRDQLNALLINAGVSAPATPPATPSPDTTPTGSTETTGDTAIPTTPLDPVTIPDESGSTPPVIPSEPVVSPPLDPVAPADTAPPSL